MDKDSGRSRPADGRAGRPPAQAPAGLGDTATIPNALEFRPDHKGEFDELVARFADGGVFIETMSDQGVYVDFSWDGGRHCQLWITVGGKSKLRYHHEDDIDTPPRFDAWGRPNAQAIEARRAIDSEAGVVGDESAVTK